MASAIMSRVTHISIPFPRLPFVGVAAVLASVLAAGAQPTSTPQARALKEFGDRLQAYQGLRQKLAGTVTPLPLEPSREQIRQHRTELIAAMRRARQHSKPGEIFTPPVVPQFRTIIRRDLRSRDVRDVLAALQELPTPFVQVNAEWPADAPPPRLPPSLRASLYPLPEGLEYRFAGRHLVLLDAEAGLVVDFVRDVVPSVAARR